MKCNKGMHMKGMDKIKILQELLGDKDSMSKMHGGEDPEGVLVVKAEGSSPKDAKKKMMSELSETELPGEAKMEMMEDEYEEGMEDEYEDEMEEEYEEDEEFEMSDEDSEIMDMIPESQREMFKQKLLEKIKSM